MQDEEYQKFHEVIEFMNERQERVMSTMKRKQKLMEEVPELREQMRQEITISVKMITENRVAEKMCFRINRKP